ncbi:flagellar motor switch phosphatase FliY [Phosphitispora fastidiosa]|uniref:flagellar motor switch phosphatase FliY n=1 Tax=Phosphitispora fastidiosa TaxID=2837202 RepID=UPI001E3D7D88|nr:flagellar motor switch phosphatase FliY [Phosphitispora fastidiosa]MBU7008277.1 flagellar motor switch protein FliN/FliY [Phosphitispora fastidiosa]
MMSDGVLSQEEIDALLRSDTLAKDTVDEAPAAGTPVSLQSENGVLEPGGGLTDMERDAVGEVANIVMGSAATALSTLLGSKVEITTPVVQVTDPDTFRQDYPLPYVLVNVEYVTGLSGANVLIIRDQDAGVMVDLMMGGDGQSPPAELSEMHISAISEAMNQMMGSASTAMSTIIKERVEISPPTVEEVNFATDELTGTLGQKGQVLVKVSFRMTIEGLIDSEIMQLIPLEFARNMVRSLMDEMTAPDMSELDNLLDQGITGVDQGSVGLEYAAAAAEPAAIHQPGTFVPDSQQAMPAGRSAVQSPQVSVQPVQFAPMQSGFQSREISNIDLIMDVPLQITVELGKCRKTIREILALGQGSVVELDKLAGEPVDLLVNGKLLAKGEVVVIDENFGIRVTDIISPIERVTNLQ